ncbi:hypothetical protein LEP1GSC060_3555 [Leptospira weilii serovar Ranarum str. ICFT]|uniref:Uncharacterized protein n=1 Tax=Leptospira weilii serovar Ranarum str. ICFT TaxID=1218598 RepID=N1WF74_9LEPT|nr:hypothetical protein LEP1GSC060_3555 [Leptospira weilii serovar Ranarum str. ICFT]
MEREGKFFEIHSSFLKVFKKDPGRGALPATGEFSMNWLL